MPSPPRTGSYDSQSDASAGLPSFEHHATYRGPCDSMSQGLVNEAVAAFKNREFARGYALATKGAQK